MQASTPITSAAHGTVSQYFSLANALTAIRFLLIVPFAITMASGEKRAAILGLMIYAVALASDFADGPMARRSGTAGPIGGTFDHTTDFLFVTSAMFAGAMRGAFPWILPSLIVVAFLQYFIDSYWIHRRGRLRKSNLGRYNGMLYFAPPVLDVVIRQGAEILHPLLTILVWTLVVSTIISIAQRLTFSLSSEKLASGAPQE